MSIKPVDFQVSIPRSSEVAKVGQLTGRGDEAQQVFSQELQKQVKQENNQIINTQKTEYNKIDKDGKNKDRNSQKKQKKDSGDKKKETGKKPQGSSTSLYDISI